MCYNQAPPHKILNPLYFLFQPLHSLSPNNKSYFIEEFKKIGGPQISPTQWFHRPLHPSGNYNAQIGKNNSRACIFLFSYTTSYTQQNKKGCVKIF